MFRQLFTLTLALGVLGCTSGGARPSDPGLGGASGDDTPLELPFALTQHYVPTGFMGDGVQGKALLLDASCDIAAQADAQGDCFRFRYEPQESEPIGWAGLYFQSEPDNWGSAPGHPIAPGADRVSFYAAASRKIFVKFLVGGIGTASTAYRDDINRTQEFEVDTSFREFEIEIGDTAYDRVLGGFGFVIEKSVTDDQQVTLYLDGIVWH